MARYQIRTSHLINGQQVNRVRGVNRSSDEAAKEAFASMRKQDATIQEGAVIRVRDQHVVQEYIGYV